MLLTPDDVRSTAVIEYRRENLKQLASLSASAPEAMNAFQALNTAIFQDGALDAKTKELIAVAVGISKECPYCIDAHSRNARRAGASAGELAEAALVAAAIGAGAAVTHATHSFE